MNAYEMLMRESKIPDRNKELVKAIHEAFVCWFREHDEEYVGEQLNMLAKERDINTLDVENYLFKRYHVGGTCPLLCGSGGDYDHAISDAVFDCVDLNKIAVELEYRWNFNAKQFDF